MPTTGGFRISRGFLEITADRSAADRTVRDFVRDTDRRLRSIGPAHIQAVVDVDRTQVDTAIRRSLAGQHPTTDLTAQVDRRQVDTAIRAALAGRRPTVDVDLRVDRARVRAALRAALPSNPRVNVDVDFDHAQIVMALEMATRLGVGRLRVDVDVDFDRARIQAALLRAFGGIGGAGGGSMVFTQIFNNVTSQAATAGAEAGAAFQGGMMKILAQPEIAIPLLAVAAGIGTFLGAAAAGALLTGASAGVVGLGILLVRKNQEVTQAASELGKTAISEFTGAAAPMVDGVVDAIYVLKDAVVELRPWFTALFTEAAPLVSILAGGVADFVRQMLPGLTMGIQSARPVIETFAYWLGRIGSAIGTVFFLISTQSQGARRGFDVLMLGVELLIGGIGGAITIAAGLFDLITQGVEKALYAFAILASVSPFADQFRDAYESYKQWMDETSTSLPTWSKLAGEMESAQVQTEFLGLSMHDAIDAAKGLMQAFDQLNGKAISARQAEADWQEAIDNVTLSIKENGKTLDLNSAKGRANNDALMQLIDTSKRRAQAIYDQTKATQGEAAAEQAALQAYRQGREQMIQSAIAMGYSRQAAEALADQLMSIPESWNTNVTVNTDQARQGVRQVGADLSGLRDKSVRVSVDAAAALTTAYALGSALGKIVSKHINIVADVSGSGKTYARRYGGVRYAAQGLLNLDGQAFAAAAGRPLYGFAEEGTGGEVFIARNAPDARSLAYADQAARWHGGRVVTGGETAPQVTVEAPVVQVYLDGKQIAARVVVSPRRVAAATDEGRRVRGFSDTARARR